MKYLSLLIAFISITTFSATAQEVAPPETAAQVETLLQASRDNDLVKFKSVCDENMKKAITAEQLTQISNQISPIMKEGYKKVYLGVLQRGAAKTHLWKIDLDKEGAPDLLAELSLIGNSVAGFLMR